MFYSAKSCLVSYFTFCFLILRYIHTHTHTHTYIYSFLELEFLVADYFFPFNIFLVSLSSGLHTFWRDIPIFLPQYLKCLFSLGYFEEFLFLVLVFRNLLWFVMIHLTYDYPWHSLSILGCCLCCCYCLVTKLCPMLRDPMDWSTPGFSVFRYLLEFAPIHVHWVGDAI